VMAFQGAVYIQHSEAISIDKMISSNAKVTTTAHTSSLPVGRLTYSLVVRVEECLLAP
jgi:hypothetical protein